MPIITKPLPPNPGDAVRGLILVAILCLGGCLQPVSTPDTDPVQRHPGETLPGGDHTLALANPANLLQASPRLSDPERLRFYIGHSFASEAWISAPASTASRDGLGPLFSTRTCLACHIQGGRGVVPTSVDQPLVSIIVRLSLPQTPQRRADPVRGVVPEPHYGDQIQLHTIQHQLTDLTTPAGGEAVPGIRWETLQGHYADGLPYELRYPILQLQRLAYGPLHVETQASLRLAPGLMGLGLLEAIPEADILGRADPEDHNGDGISGRANRVWDSRGQPRLGRFGWKAAQPSVRQQVAEAFVNDIGITSSVYPDEVCTSVQTLCRELPNGSITGTTPPGIEISDEILDAVSLFSATIALPRRYLTDIDTINRGRRLFRDIGCSDCHIPHQQTGQSSVPAIFAGQSIWPYTDLLLHDMGEGLADDREEFAANGREWRTAPLWGLAAIARINPDTGYLHDGRARNLTEAILWHGGEAARAQQAFIRLPATERENLLQFVGSL